MLAPSGDPRPYSVGPSVRASAFLLRQGRVLLVEQQKDGASYWLLPGGNVQRGESLLTAVAREVEEETGLVAEVFTPPLAVVETISPDAGRRRHLVHLVFAARSHGDREPRPADPAVRRVRWFDDQGIADLTLHPPIGDLITSWLRSFPGEIALPLPHTEWGGTRWID